MRETILLLCRLGISYFQTEMMQAPQTEPNSPIRVLHIFASPAWGGAEIHASELADWIRSEASGGSAQIETTFWCPKGSPLERDAIHRKIPVITDPLPFRAFWPKPFRFLRVMRRLQPHIVHIHWPAGLRLALGFSALLPARLRPKVILQTHMWISKPKRGFFHRLSFQACAAVTAAGPRGIGAVAKHFGIQDQKLVEIPYTIAPSALHSDAGQRSSIRAQARGKLQIADDEFVVGYFGRIDAQKGVLELVEAIEPQLIANHKLKVLLVGNPTLNEREAQVYSQKVADAIARSSGRDRFIQLPHQNDFYPHLLASDLMVMPSHHECYSILLLHAFALCVPVLSTRSGGTPDLIAEPLRGWLCTAKDTDSLRQTLSEALKPEAQSELEARADRAHAYFMANHQRPVVLKRWIQLYRKIMTSAVAALTLSASLSGLLGLAGRSGLTAMGLVVIARPAQTVASGLDVQLKDLVGSVYSDPTNGVSCQPLTRSELKRLGGKYVHCHAQYAPGLGVDCPMGRPAAARTISVFKSVQDCKRSSRKRPD